MSSETFQKASNDLAISFAPVCSNERSNDAPAKPLNKLAFSPNDDPERSPERSIVRGFSSLKEETRTNAGRTIDGTMERLFAENRIHIETSGPPSKQRQRIVFGSPQTTFRDEGDEK